MAIASATVLQEHFLISNVERNTDTQSMTSKDTHIVNVCTTFRLHMG